MIVVGAYARVDPGAAEEVARRIGLLDGIETFDLDDPSKVGILIEADSLEEAHARLIREIHGIEGVWGAWPVSVHAESGESGAERPGFGNE